MIATAPASEASKRSFYLVITVAALLVGAALGAQLVRSGMPEAPPRPPPRVWTERPVYVPLPPPQTFAQPPPPIAPFASRLPSCARYVEVMEEFIQCEQVPVEARDAARQGIDAMVQGLGDLSSLPESARQQTEAACRQAVDGIAQARAAMGCS